MPDQMYLIITVRKPIADVDEGRSFYNVVKTRLEDKPELAVSGHITNHFDLEAPQ